MIWLLLVLAFLVFFMVARSAMGPPPEDSPNANNPDALEADLDPEGDEPEGY